MIYAYALLQEDTTVDMEQGLDMTVVIARDMMDMAVDMEVSGGYDSGYSQGYDGYGGGYGG